MNFINTEKGFLFKPKCLFIYFYHLVFKQLIYKNIILKTVKIELKQSFFPFRFALYDYYKYHYDEFDSYDEYLKNHFNLTQKEFSEIYHPFLLISYKVPVFRVTSFIYEKEICCYLNNIFNGDFRYEI